MAPRARTLGEQRTTISNLMDKGVLVERKTAASFAFDAAGRCHSPITIEMQGRPSGAFGVISGEFWQERDIIVDSPQALAPLYLDGRVPCRKCPACLKQRAYYWRRRATSEIHVSMRTWFATLTLRPDRAHYFLERARERRFLAGVDLDADEADERFRQWASEIGKELTLYMKRIRKHRPRNVRHMFVFERHKSGYPHVHGLIHESGPEGRITKRTLESNWAHNGFSNFRLITGTDEMPASKVAYYVTKYLTKEACTRIRASRYYGTDWTQRLGSNVLKTHVEVSKNENGEKTTQEKAPTFILTEPTAGDA